MRISQTNEDRQGAAGDQSPPQSRPQETLRLKFPKTARLRTRADYLRVLRSGRRVQGKLISMDCRQGQGLSPRLGITVSRKFGKAHSRNYFKRIVREVFRENAHRFPEGLEINVSPLFGCAKPTKAAILEDFIHAQSSTATGR